MSYNIIESPSTTPLTTLDNWISQYKDRQVEVSHDQSMLNLVTPDDSVMVVGPPRIASSTSDSDYYVVGLANNIAYNESAQVQPMKGYRFS